MSVKPGSLEPRQTIILRTDRNTTVSKVDSLKALILSGVLMYAQEWVTYGTLNEHWDTWKKAGQPRTYLQMSSADFKKFQKTLARFPHTVVEIGGEAVLALPPAEDAVSLPGLKSARPLSVLPDATLGNELFPPSASYCPNVIVELESDADLSSMADTGARQMLAWIEMLHAEQVTRWYDTGAQLALFGISNLGDYRNMYFHAGVRDQNDGNALVRGAFVIPPRQLPTLEDVRRPVFVATVDFRDFLASKNEPPRRGFAHRNRA